MHQKHVRRACARRPHPARTQPCHRPRRRGPCGPCLIYDRCPSRAAGLGQLLLKRSNPSLHSIQLCHRQRDGAVHIAANARGRFLGPIATAIVLKPRRPAPGPPARGRRPAVPAQLCSRSTPSRPGSDSTARRAAPTGWPVAVTGCARLVWLLPVASNNSGHAASATKNVEL